MTRYLTVGAAAMVLLLSGLVHGLRTDRWGMSDARRTMADRVARLPLRIGDWTAEDMPLDARQMTIAGADAAVSRVYARSGPAGDREEVALILLSGRAAPLAVHTPDICFANVGYVMEGEPRAFQPPLDSPNRYSLWQARFTKSSDPLPRRVYWAWSDGGPWRAANSPRGEFNWARGLYKIYLVCSSPRSLPADALDPVQHLLVDLMPELQRTLMHP